MKNFKKKILRLLYLLFFLVLASFGMVAVFPTYRDKYLNNEIRTEYAERKEDEAREEKGQQ